MPSGTSAVLDPLAGTSAGSAGGLRSAIDPALATGPTPVASNGGSITLASSSGTFIGGTLRAAAGGPSAAGGTLSLLLESVVVSGPSRDDSVPEAQRVPREIVLSQNTPDDPLPADLMPGDATPFQADPSLMGQADLSVQQFDAGGFDNLSLFTRDILLFNGNVDLSARQSISLTAGDYATRVPPARSSSPPHP